MKNYVLFPVRWKKEENNSKRKEDEKGRESGGQGKAVCEKQGVEERKEWDKEKAEGSGGPLVLAQTSVANLLGHALPPVQRKPALLSDGSPGLSSLSDPLKYYLPDRISLKDSEQFPSRNRFQEQALPGPFITPISELRTWRERARREMKEKDF